MLGITEPSIVALVSGALSGFTLILVALIGTRGRRDARAAETDRADILDAVKPTNGHDSLGAGLAAIEDRLIEGDKRFDRIEVKLDEQNERFNEHIEAVEPLKQWVDMKMRKGK